MFRYDFADIVNYRNDAKMISRLVMGAQLMGLCVWLLYLVLAGLLMYVAFWPNFYKTF